MHNYKFSNLSLAKTVQKILKSESGLTVLCCTLNEVVMASEDREVANALKKADILTTDGMPLVWWNKWKTGKGERVYGPDLMRKVLSCKPKVNSLFIGDDKNKKYFENIGDYVELPFKTDFEKSDFRLMEDKVKKSRAKIVWIGLGARKQIVVAAELRRRVPNKVYVTVGAAFDFLSGNKSQCPLWIRNGGGEWLYRLVTEPRRLTGRYIRIIVFVVQVGIEKLKKACQFRY